jgi:hypothetical protein
MSACEFIEEMGIADCERIPLRQRPEGWAR